MTSPNLFGALAFTLFLLGWICLITKKQVFKQVIGLKILLQGVSLGMILAGKLVSRMALAQMLVISALVVEAVLVSLALAMIVSVYHNVPDGNIDRLRKLKG